MSELRFHNVHSKGISLSQDGTIARRTRDYGFVFTSRPIVTEEKITLKFMEVANRNLLTSAFCLGITHTDPNDFDFEDIRDFTYLDLIKKMGYLSLPLDKKLRHRNLILSFRVTSANLVVYDVDGGKEIKFDRKIDTKKKMWALIYFYENPVSVMLIRNKTLETNQDITKLYK